MFILGERFNVRRNEWEPITAMHSRRYHKLIVVIWLYSSEIQIELFFFCCCCRSTHEVVEIDNFLYALGGNDGSSSLNSVGILFFFLYDYVIIYSVDAQ